MSQNCLEVQGRIIIPISSLYDKQYIDEERQINTLANDHNYQNGEDYLIPKYLSYSFDTYSLGIFVTATVASHVLPEFVQDFLRDYIIPSSLQHHAYNFSPFLAKEEVQKDLERKVIVSTNHACSADAILVAVTHRQLTVIYPLADILRNSNGNVEAGSIDSPSSSSNNGVRQILIKKGRLEGGHVLAHAWAAEQQQSLFLGTNTGLFQLVFPPLADGSAGFDLAYLTIKRVTGLTSSYLEKASIDKLAVAPQGRYLAAISRQIPGKLFLWDSWLGSSSNNSGINVLDFHERKGDVVDLAYSPDGASILIALSTGTLVLVDSYRWTYQTFSLSNAPSHYHTPLFVALSQALSSKSNKNNASKATLMGSLQTEKYHFIWQKEDRLLFTLNARNEVYQMSRNFAEQVVNSIGNNKKDLMGMKISSLTYAIDHCISKSLAKNEKLLIKDIETTADGDFLVISYLLETTPETRASADDTEDHATDLTSSLSLFPGVDVFYSHKGECVSLTHVGTIYRNRIFKGKHPAMHHHHEGTEHVETIAQPLGFALSSSRFSRKPQGLGSDISFSPKRLQNLLTIYWSDQSASFHFI